MLHWVASVLLAASEALKIAEDAGMWNASDQYDYLRHSGLGSKRRNSMTPAQRIASAQAMYAAGSRQVARQQSSAPGGNHLRIAGRTIVRKTLNLPGARALKAAGVTKTEKKAIKKEQNAAVKAVLNAPQSAAPVSVVVNNPAPVVEQAPATAVAAPVAMTVDAVATGTEANPVDLTYDSQADTSALPGDYTSSEAVAADTGLYVGWDEAGNYWWEDGSVTAADGTWYPAEQLQGLGFLKNLLKKIPIVKNNINTIGAAISTINPAAGAAYAVATGGQAAAPAPAPAPALRVAPAAPARPLPARPSVPVRTASLTNQTESKLPSWVIPVGAAAAAVVVLGVVIVAAKK